MRDTPAPVQPAYPGSAERVYARLRRHQWLVDGTLAAILLAGSVNSFDPVLPASLVLAGAVAVRRRFPVAAYAVALAVGAAQVAVGIGPKFAGSPLQPTFADVGILVLLFTVAAERPRRVSLPAVAACVVLFAAAVAQLTLGLGQPLRPMGFLVTGVFYLLAPMSAWVLGDSMAYRRAYSAALEDRAVRAERERDAQAQIAVAAERARIARELHDVIAHSLSVMVAQADGGRYAFDTDPERSRQALAQIGRTGRQALGEMSSLLGVLRTGAEAPPLAPAPSAPEIAQLVAQAREAGMRVSHTAQGTVRPLPGGLSLAAYRIVQEALTNVRKHADPGATATVTIRYGRDHLLIRVADDGRGAASSPGRLPRYGTAERPGTARPDGNQGHGLAGMRERAEMYGGTVQAGTRSGGGFEVTARLPLAAATPPLTAPPPATPALAVPALAVPALAVPELAILAPAGPSAGLGRSPSWGAA
jgi:signal transduction histidine kinase